MSLTAFTAITLSIAFVTGLSYLLSLMFSVQNYGSLADTHTGLPLAELFWQVTSTRGGAFGLVFMVWIALGPCVLGSQLSEFNATVIKQSSVL
jgi:choline transport protein